MHSKRTKRRTILGTMLGLVSVSAAVLLLTVQACTPTITCEDVGCPYGESCDAISGRCVMITKDCRRDASICSADQSCDQTTGSCLSAQVSCVNQQTCPPTQACNAAAGICQNVGSCGSARDCAAGQLCDNNSGQCVAKACVASEECGAGLICVLGRCQPGCDASVPCPAEAICQRSATQDYGECILSCSADQECNFGRYCNFLKAPPVCEPEPACQDDATCRSDEVCQDGICSRPPCRSNADCGDAQICDTREGSCLGESCEDDRFSPNHSAAAAALLEPMDYVELTKCPGRADWFKISLQSAELLTVEVSHGFGQDLDLTLYDRERRPLAANSERGHVSELSYQSTHDQEVWLKIDDTSLNAVIYGLKVTRRTSSSCAEDGLEENDSLEQATSLMLQPGDVVGLPIALCGDDEDWLSLGQLKPTSTLSLELEAQTQAQATMLLYTPDGQMLSAQLNEPISLLRVGVEGEYIVRLKKDLSAPLLGAQLRAAIGEDYTCSDVTINDAPQRALILERGGLSSHVLCFGRAAWETDWFELEAPTQGSSNLVLRMARPNPEGARLAPEIMELSLFREAQPGQLEFVRAAVHESSGTYGLAAKLPALEPGQRWLVKVSTAEALGRVFAPALYQLTYRYEQD